MINNLPFVLESKAFKDIPQKVTPQEFVEMVVPKGYEDLICALVSDQDVMLSIVNKEQGYQSQITIPNVLFSSFNANFPKFRFTNLKAINYVLNQNQIMHLMMLERFEQFRPMSNPYLNLLGQDFKVLKNYIDYNSVGTYNTKLKAESLEVIIPFKDMNSLTQDFMKGFQASMDETKWNAFFLNNDVSVSSLGEMSKSSAVAMGFVKYRAPAFSLVKDGFTCIFPKGPNIPARLQTHLLGNAYPLFEPDVSIIQQDNLIVDGKLVPKDKTMKKAIAVFHPLDTDNCRLMAGEIEVTPSIPSTLVIVTKNIEENFKTLNVKEGETYETNFEPFTLGSLVLGDDVVLEGYKSITITSIRTTGINGTKKVYFDGVRKSGNARIISNTGVKGVTKVRNDLGTIHFKHTLEPIEMDSKELKKRYPTLDQRSLTKYKPVEKQLQIKPDMVLGMNSAKAKSNTIVLAGACLAVELGFYKPAEKHGFEGLLNSLNEKEINDAYNSLPKFKYVNEFGKEVEVFVGLVYVNFTELGETYTKFKDIPFAFESGKFLNKDANPYANQLYDYIWKNYLDEVKVSALKEYYECYLTCTENVLNNTRNLPIYNLDKINELFDEKDLILSKLQEFASDSKLLDEEFNKGFYIDLSKFKGAPVIQIPSAKTLKLFSGEMKNGQIVYHINVVNVSKIIRGCLKVNGSYSLNTVYSKDKTRYTSALAFNSYINTLKSIIFSSADESQHLVQTLIKPKIPGCNLKQVAESTLPDSTVVISDKKLFRQLRKESLKGSQTTIEDYDVKLMYLTNNLDILDQEKLEELFQELNKSYPMCLSIRNPSLWTTQNICARIWDLDMFNIYLHIYKKVSINQVINTDLNKDILLTSLDILVKSHGDADGEKSPLSLVID